MTFPALPRARSLDEPGAGIPHAGISQGAVGQPAVLPKWQRRHSMRYISLRILLVVATISMVSGCATIKKNTTEETHEYRTATGQVAGGRVSWPAAPKEITEDDLKKTKDTP